MKAGERSDEQIVALLQEAQRGEKSIVALCRQKSITQNTFYAWPKKHSGMQARDVQRLRELEKENARLKGLLAERDLDIDILKEVTPKNF